MSNVVDGPGREAIDKFKNQLVNAKVDLRDLDQTIQGFETNRSKMPAGERRALGDIIAQLERIRDEATR